MKRVIVTIIALLLVVSGFGAWLRDLRNDRLTEIKVTKEIPSYEDWESLSASPTGKIGTGEKLKVLRIRYAKDHMAIKVEREDGSKVWIFKDSSVEIK